jgi:hypothetical protein
MTVAFASAKAFVVGICRLGCGAGLELHLLLGGIPPF